MTVVINPSLVPTIAPGNLFAAFTEDSTLNVRWLTPTDPVLYSVLNRPLADVVLRQLVLAKTLDNLSISIGHEAMFPFLIQAQVAGTSNADLPAGWIWDLHMTAPSKWENFRLAKIKRLDGTQVGTGGYTGTLRLIFTASIAGSTIEVAIFYADYLMDSALTYQRARLTVCTTAEEPISIDPGEKETVSGFITLRTLPQDEPLVQAFYNVIPPGTSVMVYDMVDAPAGGTAVLNDYSALGLHHGTGLLVDSTENALPASDSNIQSWIDAFNYPFDANANRTSSGTVSIQIPIGLFREFNIPAPAGDEPSGDTSGTYFPVWISRIEPVGTANNQLRLYFATHNVTDTSPSMDAIEFARLDLLRSMVSGELVVIEPLNNLELQTGSDSAIYNQHFGRGHVVLSSVWSSTSADVDAFFDAFAMLVGQDIEFTQSSTRISSFGISRVPKYTPTIGQGRALVGTTSNLASPIPPSEDNRFVVEQDQGLGNSVDLEASLSPILGVNRYGYDGALAHKIVQLCIDYTKLPSGTETGTGTFYEDNILPRLTILLGRPPQFGDFWYQGTELLFFNGNSWQTA
jgi:hypothetical protein